MSSSTLTTDQETIARFVVTTETHTKAMLVYKSENKRAYLAQLAPTRGKKMAALQHL